MLVLKFGGSSVGSPGGIEKIIDILNEKEHSGKIPAVIVSAFSGVTDALIEMAHIASRGENYSERLSSIIKRHKDCASHFLNANDKKNAVKAVETCIGELSQILDGISLLGELSSRSLDLVMSFGERLSASLLAFIFSAKGVEAAYLDARGLVKTNAAYNRAEVLKKETEENIRAFFKGAKMPCR